AYAIPGDAYETQPEDAAVRIYGDDDRHGGRFGSAIANLGDIDGDGSQDVAISGALQVDVFHGPLTSTMVSSDADAFVTSSTGIENFGVLPGSTGSAGDVDGDGHPDLLVGNSIELAGKWAE